MGGEKEKGATPATYCVTILPCNEANS